MATYSQSYFSILFYHIILTDFQVLPMRQQLMRIQRKLVK